MKGGSTLSSAQLASGVPRRRALLCVLKNALDPAEFSAFLLNEQLQHPDGFMIRMTNFANDVCECCLLLLELFFQQFLATDELLAKRPWPCLP